MNDGSTDGTDALAHALCAENSSVRLITHASNRGYGAALRSGFSVARYDLIFLTDADGQFSFGDLSGFVAQIDGLDAVIGYRQGRADLWHRLLISAIGNWIARRAFSLHARDIDCAFKLIRREAIRGISLGSDGTMISTELLAQAMRAGWRMKESPVPHHPREYGVSTTAKPAVIWRTVVEFFALLPKQKRQSRVNSKDCDQTRVPVRAADAPSRAVVGALADDHRE